MIVKPHWLCNKEENMLKSIIKNSFKETNECIILLAPLVLIVTFIFIYSLYIYNSANNIFKFFLSSTAMIVVVSICFSAWFYLLKKVHKLSDKVFVYDSDRVEEVKKIFNSVSEGISSLFIPIFLFFIFYALLYGYFTILFYEWGVNYLFIFVDTGLSYFTPENIFAFVMVLLMHYILLFTIPEIVYVEKNPYKAFINSVKKLVITFPHSLLLFLYIFILLLLVYLFSLLLLSLSPYLYFVVSLFLYYIILYVFVLIFGAYEKFFLK